MRRSPSSGPGSALVFIGFVLLDYLRFMGAVWQLPEPPPT